MKKKDVEKRERKGRERREGNITKERGVESERRRRQDREGREGISKKEMW